MQDQFVFSTREVSRYRFPTHANDLVLDRAQADTSEVFIVVLEPGEATPLHVHPDTEQIFYVIEGTGVLEIGEMDKRFPMQPGDVVRVPPHAFHRIQCTSPHTLRYLSVDCFVGGRPKDEPTWDSHVRAVCALNGWDYEQVKR